VLFSWESALGPLIAHSASYTVAALLLLIAIRLAALVAVGGAGPSAGALADAAVVAGASAAQIVDVLVAVIPLVGFARAVAAAPEGAIALGYDISEAP
jgi:4-carboxymuconolactone decarboxylase